MFNLFKRRPKPASRDTRPASAVEFDDGTITSKILDAFKEQPDIVGALFLVAHTNVQTHFHFFKREAAHGGYPPTMWGFSGFLAAEGRKRTSASIEDEASRRRFFYFYIGLALVPGARALRKTLDNTSLWSADEAAYFAEIKTEGEGEEYWLGFLAPDAIRYHRKVFAWYERDLPPETIASIRETEKLMRGE